ncbi:hypothetical protein [Desulfuromonas sp.]|uniref:hypothetical protein n=1 Tax=Desulfuromonas sp. TaxID=892 RepID=UPI0025BA9FB0|nr:hypothetical protein [Desulfuromonas sp.]
MATTTDREPETVALRQYSKNQTSTPRRSVLAGLLLVVLFVGFAGEAWSATYRRTLLRLEQLRQSVALTYNYNGRTFKSDYGQDNNAHAHRFGEKYQARVQYSILGQDLLHGSLLLGLSGDQVTQKRANTGDTDSTSGYGLEYEIDGVLFDERPYNLAFYARSYDSLTSEPFNFYSYETYNDAYGLSLLLSNDTLPSSVSYDKNRNETDGIPGGDRTLTNDSFTLESRHVHEEKSTTKMRVRLSSNQIDYHNKSDRDKSTRSAKVTVNNRYYAGDKTKTNLRSNFSFSKDSGFRENRTLFWGEGLEVVPGKALKLGAEFDYAKSDNDIQDRVEWQTRAYANHTLFRNLTTRLEGHWNYSDLSIGTEKHAFGLFNLGYRKVLPKNGRISISLTEKYGITDRNVSEQRTPVRGELIRVEDPFDLYLLGNPNILVDTIEVFIWVSGIPLDEGIDYEIFQDRENTYLFFADSATVQPGMAIAVDYIYIDNDSVEYSTNYFASSANLSLFNNRYELYTAFIYNNQKLISGDDTLIPLDTAYSYLAGINANYSRFSCGTKALYFDSPTDTYFSLEGFGNYKRRIGQNNLYLQARDIYTRQIDDDNTNNDLILEGKLHRKLGRKAKLKLRGYYRNRTGTRDRDDIIASADLEMGLGRVKVHLTSSLRWIFYDDTSSRQDNVLLRLTRFF